MTKTAFIYFVERHSDHLDLQIAASLNSGCQVFLTNDPILRRVTELRVLVLNELEL